MKNFYPQLINFPPVLDFEASSLDRENSYPISVGLIAGGKTHYWLIKPKKEWTDWSERSAQVHGLKREHLLTHGTPVDEVLENIKSILGKNKFIYSDCPKWEEIWGYKLGLDYYKFLHIDTLVTPDKHYKLQLLTCDFFEKESLTPHNALHDAICIALAAHQLS